MTVASPLAGVCACLIILSIAPCATAADCNLNGIDDDVETAVEFPVTVTIGTGLITETMVAIADIDGDGFRDIVTTGSGGSAEGARWYRNDGNGVFPTSETISTSGASILVPVDIDGDGDIDVATNGVRWHRNDPGSTWTEFPVDSLAWVRDLAAADLDGDGDQDLLVAADLQLSWYENTNGAGAFTFHDVLGSASMKTVVAGDFDADGHVDVAWSGETGVFWRPGLGNGIFGSAIELGLFINLDDLHTIESEGDDGLDLIGVGLTEGVVLFPQAAGAFGSPIVISPLSGDRLSIADLSGDGVRDLIVVDEFDDEIRWHRGLGGGSFSSPQPIVALNRPSSADAADLDYDGDVDLAAVWSDGVGASALITTVFLPNDSDDCNGNTRPDECDLLFPALDCDANGILDSCEQASGDQQDCNGNGVGDVCDIASAGSDDCSTNGIPDECEPDCNENSTADSCDIRSGTSPDGDGNGVPDECDPDCNENGISDSTEITAGTASDCDGNDRPDECDIADGAPDCDADGKIDTCELNRSFQQYTLDGISNTVSVFAVDLDGDGDLDRLTPYLWNENVNGSFMEPVILGSVRSYPADVDRDGDIDLIGAFYWKANDGNASFGPSQQIHSYDFSTYSSVAVLAPDLDADGDPDLVALLGYFVIEENSWQYHVVWTRNLGGETFGPIQTIIPPAEWVRGPTLSAGDLDGDGDLDLVTAGRTTLEEYVWHPNAGDGTFLPSRPIASWAGFGYYNVGAHPADLDNDGDLDVVTAIPYAWYENLDGEGNFGPTILIDADGGTSTNAGVPADINGDGLLDFVGSSYSSFAWYENSGAGGGVWLRRVIGVPDSSVAVGDIDADGDLDILARDHWWRQEAQDCDGNGIVDGCDGLPDCDGDGIPDGCVLATGASPDCDKNGVPDSCDAGCTGDCDLDNDGCADVLDCAATNPTAWAPPSPARDLRLEGAENTSLGWLAPVEPGGLTPRYDLLRSGDSDDFTAVGVCFEWDTTDLSASDTDSLGSEEVFYYLIRAENDCAGSSGVDSSGTPREAISCPLEGPGEGSCCETDASQGCNDLACQIAVCEVEPLCCVDAWGPSCADLAASGFCPALCAGAGDCCTANGTPGCVDTVCQTLVCEIPNLDGCCTNEWSTDCAGSALILCEETCTGPGCCTAGVGPGCDDPVCEALVCAQDSFCCNVQWDSVCAGIALGAPVCGCGA